MGTNGYKARPITAKAKDSSRGCSPAPLKQTKEKGWMNQAGHLALDIAGLIPGYGEIADGANAAWYAAEGDMKNAALSTAAMIPFAGWGATATKLGLKGYNKTAKVVKGVDKVSKMKIPKLLGAAQPGKSAKFYADDRTDKLVNKLAGEDAPVTPKVKAKKTKSNGNLNSLIKARKSMKKGSDEYNANQNKINALMGNKKRY